MVSGSQLVMSQRAPRPMSKEYMDVSRMSSGMTSDEIFLRLDRRSVEVMLSLVHFGRLWVTVVASGGTFNSVSSALLKLSEIWGIC